MRLHFLPLCVLALGCGRTASVSDPAPASSELAPPPPAAALLEGSVSIMSAPGELSASAFFALGAGETGTPVGDCALEVTPKDTRPPASASAGDVVVDVPSQTPLRVAYDGSEQGYAVGSLEGTDPSARVDARGAAIRVHAAGATVPAFDATVIAADDVSLTSPTSAFAISEKSDDLAVAWTPNANESVIVALSFGGALVTCKFPASAQRGVIPSSLVRSAAARLAGSKCVGACGSLSFMAFRSTETRAGAWSIHVSHALTQQVPVSAGP